MTTNTSQPDEDEFSNYLKNLKPCMHCYNRECSATRLMDTHLVPIYKVDKNSRSIDINMVVDKLPMDLLIKIYNDYIRPHKYSQLFNILTVNSFFERELYKIRISEFIKHFHIFIYTPIKTHIMKIDAEFNQVMINLNRRHYRSIFAKISNIKSSVFIEILMNKYH